MTTSEDHTHKQTDQVLAYMREHTVAMMKMDIEPAAICRGLAIILGVLINKCVSSSEEKMYAIDAIGQLILDASNDDERTLQ